MDKINPSQKTMNKSCKRAVDSFKIQTKGILCFRCNKKGITGYFLGKPYCRNCWSQKNKHG